MDLLIRIQDPHSGAGLFFIDGNLIQPTVQYLAQAVQGMGGHIASGAQSGKLPRGKLVAVNHFILGNFLLFHGIPKRFIGNHQQSLLFLFILEYYLYSGHNHISHKWDIFSLSFSFVSNSEINPIRINFAVKFSSYFSRGRKIVDLCQSFGQKFSHEKCFRIYLLLWFCLYYNQLILKNNCICKPRLCICQGSAKAFL